MRYGFKAGHGCAVTWGMILLSDTAPGSNWMAAGGW